MTDDNKKLLTFPCTFPIKIVGKANDAFEIAVLDILRRHAPDLKATALSNRHSKNEKYLAITVTIEATSQEQLDSIYIELSNHELVIMAL